MAFRTIFSHKPPKYAIMIVPKEKGGEQHEEVSSKVWWFTCGVSHCCNNNE